MKTLTEQFIGKGMSHWYFAQIKFRTPLTAVNCLVHLKCPKGGPIGEISKHGATKPQLSDQCRVLDKPLIVLCPSR